MESVVVELEKLFSPSGFCRHIMNSGSTSLHGRTSFKKAAFERFSTVRRGLVNGLQLGKNSSYDFSKCQFDESYASLPGTFRSLQDVEEKKEVSQNATLHRKLFDCEVLGSCQWSTLLHQQ